jgi:hypothetical protein
MGSQDHHADACFFDPQSTVRQSAASSHPGPSCSAAQSIQPLASKLPAKFPLQWGPVLTV